MQEKTAEFTDKYGECKLVARYGLQHFQGQDPYFSITATEYRKRYGVWRDEAGGCLHDEIAEHIPELEPLIKWYLVSFKEPMHYIANGMFWWDRSRKTDPKPLYRGDMTAFGEKALENFKSIIVYGAIEEDNWAKKVVSGYHKVDREAVQKWLFDRLPKLMEAFCEDMIKFGVE